MQQTNEPMFYAYFMPNGEILTTLGRSVDTHFANQAHMVIMNHGEHGNSAPFCEIVKSRGGSAGIISTEV